MATLSQRESEVLHLIAYEYTSEEIADKLYLSTHTVQSHRKNLLLKLQVKNSAGLVRVAFEKGVFSAGSSGQALNKCLT